VLSDRLAIQDLIFTYSLALDERRREDWDRICTTDAVYEYAPPIGRQTPADAWAILTRNDATRISGTHLVSNVIVSVRGDNASARSECLYTHVDRTSKLPSHAQLHFMCVTYEDEFVRTPAGWRLRFRRLRYNWRRPPEDIPWSE
jgi:hypothetical protein